MSLKNKKDLNEVLQKTAQILSQRSHSEKELKQKLSSHFSLNLVEQSIHLAKQKKWLEDPYELSLQTTHQLHTKNKSWTHIKGYLQNKGLPLPEYDKDKELKKAKILFKKKASQFKIISQKEKIKIKRFLAYRLFEESIINEIMEELS